MFVIYYVTGDSGMYALGHAAVACVIVESLLWWSRPRVVVETKPPEVELPPLHLLGKFRVPAPEKRIDEFPACKPWVGPEAEEYLEFKAELQKASK